MRLFSWSGKIRFFSIVAASVWFVSCFRVNILRERFEISCYYWGLRELRPWILMHQISILNRRLISNISCFKSNWFELNLNILNLDWRQEIMLTVFWKHFTWHTQNIIWESFFVDVDSEQSQKTIYKCFFPRRL